MMKASACAAMIVALCSCADDQNISDLYTPSLEAHYIACYESSNINLASDEAHYSFYLEATNTPWQFSGMADWLTVEPKSGNYDAQVTFSAGKNPSGEDILNPPCRLILIKKNFQFPNIPPIRMSW